MERLLRNIAFVGPMHSGKTTAAKYLVEHYGYERISLADGVKQLASDMLTDCAYLLTGSCKHPTVEDINRNKAAFRPFLQWLGTDFVREYLGMPTYWIDSFLLAAQESRKPVVCDDVRFVNEAEALKRQGFVVIRLNRYAEDRLKSLTASGGTLDTQNHRSETELDAITPDMIWHTRGMMSFEDALDHLIKLYEEIEDEDYASAMSCAQYLDDLVGAQPTYGISHLPAYASSR